MGPLQSLIFNAIKKRGKAGLSVERLMLMVEQHRNIRRLDPPKHPRKIVHVTVNQINRQLGHVIHGGKGGDRLYHFDPVDDAWKGVIEAYELIRARKAAGGKGWEP